MSDAAKRHDEKLRLMERLRQINEEEQLEREGKLAAGHKVVISLLLPGLIELADEPADKAILRRLTGSGRPSWWPENLLVELYVNADQCYVTVTED